MERKKNFFALDKSGGCFLLKIYKLEGQNITDVQSGYIHTQR